MTNLCCDVLRALEGKSLATAESCTGGMIGAVLTAVPGSSAVYKGGVISYTNQVKHDLLGVPNSVLDHFGAVSEPVAEAMALGARKTINADVAVSITGLAGPGGDDFGNSVGTVYIGYADSDRCIVKCYCFDGDRDMVRRQATEMALRMILEYQV